MKDEVLTLALDALEESVDLVREDYENAKKLYGKYPSRQARLLGMEDGLLKHEKAITAIKQTLAAPTVQEPVAWMHVMDNTEGIKANGKGIVSITQKRKHPFGKPGVDFSKSYPVTSTPLYTTPPAAQRQWVGLTDEDKLTVRRIPWETLGDLMDNIEAKLKEKNT